MSGLQIVFLIWLILLTLALFPLYKVVYVLAKDRLDRADRAEKMRQTLGERFDRNDPKSNPFLKAGMAAVKEQKKREGSQDG